MAAHRRVNLIGHSEDGTRIQCLECEKWYKALVTHLERMHGISCDEYREAHGIAVTTPLCAPESTQKRVAIGRNRRDADPRVIDALTGPGAVLGRTKATPASREIPRRASTGEIISENKRARDAERFAGQLAAAGYSSLAEAIDHATRQGWTWQKLCDRLGVSATPLKRRARAEGLVPPEPISEASRRWLAEAREYVERHGSFEGAPKGLSGWLAGRRYFNSHGPIDRELDRIYPGWRERRRGEGRRGAGK